MQTEIYLTKPAPHFFQNAFSNRIQAVVMLECLARIEYAGANWILGVPQSFWTTEIHAHAQDELHHCRAMLDAARAGRALLTAEELKLELKLTSDCLKATDRYLSSLFRKCIREFSSSNKDSAFPLWAYYALSLSVERRIIRIYPSLASHGITAPLRDIAKKLIFDEKDHFKMMAEGAQKHVLQMKEMIPAMQAIEEQEAKLWIETLEGVLA